MGNLKATNPHWLVQSFAGNASLGLRLGNEALHKVLNLTDYLAVPPDRVGDGTRRAG